MHLVSIILATTLTVLGLGFAFWMIWLSIRRSDEPLKLTFKWIVTPLIILGGIYEALMWGPYGPFLIAMLGISLSIMWTPHLSDWVMSPFMRMFDGGDEPPEKRPLYSIAISKRKAGKPLEAVMELRKQLAKFPKDFEGIMLLAGTQAEDLMDLPGAEITLNKFCQATEAPPKQVAAAFTQLADWHLKLAQDADAARADLQKIIDRYPDSELSLHAEQRIAHLGGAQKILLAAHDRQPLELPEGVHNLGLQSTAAFIVPEEIEPGKLAAAYVKHLEEHPKDTEIREKLAIVYAKDFKRLDLATMELAQLINEPRHPPKDVARWLNVLANLQIELGADCATVSETLEKIVTRYPTLPIADVARRRLARLEGELRGQKETPSIKLGVYEQNIGLKRGSPRQL